MHTRTPGIYVGTLAVYNACMHSASHCPWLEGHCRLMMGLDKPAIPGQLVQKRVLPVG